MSQILAQFQIALMTLTRLPAGHIRGEVPQVARSVWAFPVVGVIVGGLAALVFVAATALGLPPSLAGLLAIAISVLATGALHEDGLADLADGFGGGHSIDRKLEIMRDSRIGSYGAVALILSVGIRAVAIGELQQAAWALIALAAFSRGVIPLVMCWLPPARADGLGRSAGAVSAQQCLISLVLGAVAVVFLQASAFPVILGMVVAAALVSLLAKRQIGGFTGDVLGATQQVTEISGWLILAAIS
ncbi:adenosylcobinamide-GDP ribazoletransferase [Actibacterium pelagium]|uniref:Adenosylcobinamide-GDP ribazoletransferase n=1 Tax=Actibacterium pelagium TaxID=2029103 RepID=A0A917AMK3_9RHOB|nr:adenosylcobinamide-GDP ribazoletransferase [Actibacterium pelagium]GGE60587.1 adenosylcobinamide-GDP ribazoletransferase [Actibacterium pelagium]